MYRPPRAYQSTTPTASAILKQRWDERVYKEHREKIANMKPYVDNKSPKTHLHLQQRLKKYVTEEYRMAMIQRDNYTLLTKMAAVMQGKGTLDNWNDYKIMSRNGPLRQRVQLRIAQENQAILARIETVQPYYDHGKWQREWLNSKAYMAYIAKYPHAGVHHRQKFKSKLLQDGSSAKSLKTKSASAVQSVYWPSNKSMKE